MGLDVVMLGMKAIREEVAENLATAALVQYLQKNVPEALTAPIGEPGAALTEGHRVGGYGDLHVLRGLALRFEQGADLARATEEDLTAAAEEFFNAQPPPATRFAHLVNHSDCDGFYVPLPITDPLDIRGTLTPPGGEPEEVNVSVGASAKLLAELDELGPVLGLERDTGEIGEEEFDRLAAAHRWPTAAHVWGLLHWYARESVRDGTVILFC